MIVNKIKACEKLLNDAKNKQLEDWYIKWLENRLDAYWLEYIQKIK